MRTVEERYVYMCCNNVSSGGVCYVVYSIECLCSHFVQLASLPAQCSSVGGESRKKMSLNHLLNFTLSPREAHGSSSGGEAGRRRRWKTHSYNKEQFLQAK